MPTTRNRVPKTGNAIWQLDRTVTPHTVTPSSTFFTADDDECSVRLVAGGQVVAPIGRSWSSPEVIRPAAVDGGEWSVSAVKLDRVRHAAPVILIIILKLKSKKNTIQYNINNVKKNVQPLAWVDGARLYFKRRVGRYYRYIPHRIYIINERTTHTHIALVTGARNICTQGDFFFFFLYDSRFIGNNFHVHIFENICCVFFFLCFLHNSVIIYGNNNGNI